MDNEIMLETARALIWSIISTTDIALEEAEKLYGDLQQKITDPSATIAACCACLNQFAIDSGGVVNVARRKNSDDDWGLETE